MALLEASGIGKNFGETKVLKDISLTLEQGDALRGNTRSHPEHDGKDLSGRWYCTGDGVGE